MNCGAALTRTSRLPCCSHAPVRSILLLQTNPQWQSIFDTYGVCPRHPSQLSAAAGRCGAVCILNLYIRKPRPMGAVSGLFLIGYGAFRIIVEFPPARRAVYRCPGCSTSASGNLLHPDDRRRRDHDGLGISRSPQQHVS
ncbi:prolipoprotein diacylglyceryl transferase family protein [Escherichia coli]